MDESTERVKFKGHILLAEDEPLVRNLAVRILERNGYKVTATCDGREAIEAFESSPADFDALVLDVIMPRCSGRAAWNTIFKQRRLPTLFCSGYPKDDLHDLQEDSLLRFLLKPYSPAVLIQQLEELMAQNSASGEG